MQQFLFTSESDFDNYGAETSAVACVAATRQHWEDAAITPSAPDTRAWTCDVPDYLSEMFVVAGFMRFELRERLPVAANNAFTSVSESRSRWKLFTPV